MKNFITIAAMTLALGCGGPARAHDGASELSALSMLPVAISVAAPVGMLSAGAAFTVVAVESAAGATVWVLERASDGVVDEVILATGFSAEGEATAHVLAQALTARGLRVTRLARGVPAGSELEYVDLSTIAHALSDRR